MPLTDAVSFNSVPLQGFDHLASFCAFLNIPLLTDNLHSKLIAERLYPDLHCHLQELNLYDLITEYDTFIHTFEFQNTFDDFYKEVKKSNPASSILNKKIRHIHMQHGCSDKGYLSEGRGHLHITHADLVLSSGQRMIDLYKDIGILPKIKSLICTGNVRYQYYLQHKDFYDTLINDEILLSFKEKKPIILYAPSFDDDENSSSFNIIAPILLEKLPDTYNLIIKLHPYLTQPHKGYRPDRLKALLKRYEKQSNLVILPNYPLVYPILNATDIFLGDFSSVGYDCLAFDIPMYFFNHNDLNIKTDKSAYLHRCGLSLLPKDFPHLYSIIDKTLQDNLRIFKKKRQETYSYAFAKDIDLKKNLDKALIDLNAVD